jgi:anion-transporting  ArsA/GET3 family ATPase
MDLDGLFERRLLVNIGKGGVGKTTVSCALALAAARAGRRVLLCEVDGVFRAAQLLAAPRGDAGVARAARGGVWVMDVEGTAALAEYLGMIIPVRRLLRSVFESQVYQYFVAAAPGLKELMTIGKIWYEVDREERGGGRVWDLVIVDSPATGHGLQYLRMPSAARDAFGVGLVHREAERLVGLLGDADKTAVNLVTTAEDMPVNETVAMAKRVRDELHLPLGGMFVNRLHQRKFRASDVKSLRDAARRCRDGAERAILDAVAARAEEESGWARLNARYLAQLAEEIPVPRWELPFVFAEEFGVAELEHLVDIVAAAQRGAR